MEQKMPMVQQPAYFQDKLRYLIGLLIISKLSNAETPKQYFFSNIANTTYSIANYCLPDDMLTKMGEKLHGGQCGAHDASKEFSDSTLIQGLYSCADVYTGGGGGGDTGAMVLSDVPKYAIEFLREVGGVVDNVFEECVVKVINDVVKEYSESFFDKVGGPWGFMGIIVASLVALCCIGGLTGYALMRCRSPRTNGCFNSMANFFRKKKSDGEEIPIGEEKPLLTEKVHKCFIQ